MTTAVSSKVCEQCVVEKPLIEFRRRSRTDSARLNQCRKCHNRAERQRRAKKQANSDFRQMGKYLTQLKNERNNDRLDTLCREMFKRFGGLDGFVDEWERYYDLAMQQGGFPAFKCFQTLFRLMEYREDRQPQDCEI